MWMPRQLKVLNETLRSGLEAIQQTSRDQVNAIRDAEKAARENREEIPRAIAAVQTPEADRRDESTYRKKNYTVQVILAVGTCGAFIAAAVYAGLAYRTLREAQKQTEINASLLVEERNTLETEQSQFDRTMKQMIAQTVVQAGAAKASQQAAAAATFSANTAKQALHISERAYIAMSSADLTELTQHRIQLQFTNIGHIPSRQMVVVVYRTSTRAKQVPGGIIWVADGTEKGWHRTVYDRVFPTAPVYLTVMFPSVPPESIMNGARELIVAGTFSYDDGFPDDPLASEDFCFRTFADTDKKQIIAVPCEPKRVIPMMQKLTGYPNNEEDQDSFQ
jgi:hypothetical protein